MEKLIGEFKKTRLALIQAVDNFPKERREEILFGKWSLKDLMAHISGWDIATVDCLKKLKRGETPKWAGSVYEFNKQNIKKRKTWSWQGVYREFVEKGKELIKEYEIFPEELWKKRVWENRGLTPQKFLEIDIRHYRDKHLPQIEKFVRKETPN